jgi:hypothetical protein
MMAGCNFEVSSQDSSPTFSDAAIRMEDKPHSLACHTTHHFLRQQGSRSSTELFVMARESVVWGMGLNRQEARSTEEAQELSVLLIDGLLTLEIS